MFKRCTQFDRQIGQKLHFSGCSKKQNMAYFKIKIYVTKVWKSKISDDSLLAFSVAFILAYFVFSLVAVFMEKFSDQNHLLWKFSKKVGKVHFVQQNLHLRNFSPQPISINLICPSEKFVLDPQSLIGDSVFMKIWWKQNRPFSECSAKN